MDGQTPRQPNIAAGGCRHGGIQEGVSSLFSEREERVQSDHRDRSDRSDHSDLTGLGRSIRSGMGDVLGKVSMLSKVIAWSLFVEDETYDVYDPPPGAPQRAPRETENEIENTKSTTQDATVADTSSNTLPTNLAPRGVPMSLLPVASLGTIIVGGGLIVLGLILVVLAVRAHCVKEGEAGGDRGGEERGVAVPKSSHGDSGGAPLTRAQQPLLTAAYISAGGEGGALAGAICMPVLVQEASVHQASS